MKDLKKYPEFNREFQQKRNDGKTFASDHHARVSWIYFNSERAEESHRHYLVGRIFNEIKKEKRPVN